MRKEIDLSPIELETLAANLAGTFIQRRDLYAQQRNDGRYICVRAPLTDDHLMAHLRGEITLGAYVLSPESRTQFVVVDADDDQTMDQITKVNRWLSESDVPSYLEKSRRGGHLWLFFDGDRLGEEVRRFGAGLLAYHDLEEVELFPKQNRLVSGPGSLIRLPFGVHRKSGRRYGFFFPNGRPLAPSLRRQIQILATPRSISQPFFEWFRDYSVEGEADLLVKRDEPDEPIPASASNGELPLSERLKAAVRVRPFVESYVPLSAKGTGLCPFHDDNAASFSINQEENYWHCFACGTGGSIIDFWMQWQNCDFTTAVRELAAILL